MLAIRGRDGRVKNLRIAEAINRRAELNPKTFTVKRTYPPEVEGAIIVEGVDFESALVAHESANYSAIIINDSDGLPACIRPV